MVLWAEAKEERCQGNDTAKSRFSMPCGRWKGARRSAKFVGRWGVAAGGLQLEAAIRGTGIERAAGAPAIAGREPQAQRDRGGPHVGQTHFAGGALKKGLKPAKRRELGRQVRQAYQLSEKACLRARTNHPMVESLPVPTKKSVLVEIIAFAKPRRVAFSGHADPTFLSARLFPSARCSASRDSCTSPSAPGLASFEPWS
jgi:hypothetical protein